MARPADGQVIGEVKHAFEPRLEWNEEVRGYLSQAYGAAKFDDICAALCRPSRYSCIRVNTLTTTRKDVVQKIAELDVWRQLVRPDGTGGSLRPWEGDLLGSDAKGPNVTEQEDRLRVYGGQLRLSETQEDSALAEDTAVGNRRELPGPTDERGHLTSGGSIEEHASLENVVLLRGQGPCEVNYSTDDGGPLKEVVVSRKCAEAVLRGANVFVPGVLACSAHIEQGDVVAISVAVERPDGNGGWSVGLTRGTTLSSEHAKSQLDGYTRSGWYIGKGQAMMSRAAMFKENEGVAVHLTDRVYRLPPFNGLLKGEIFIQNLPSVVAAQVLDPKPGEYILDMCAAPGGKTTAVALLMKDQGDVIALDRSHNKVRAISSLAAEMGLTCIRAYKLDALKAVQKDSTQQAESDASSQSQTFSSVLQARELHTADEAGSQSNFSGPYVSKAEERKTAQRRKNGPGKSQNVGEKVNTVTGFAPRSFDRVLLDAPCSALGLRPRLFAGEETLDKLRKNGSYQRKMFDQAVKLVRPGGTLVYSTCTINPGENEAVVRYALDKYSFLSLVPQTPVLGGPGLVGGLGVFDGVSCREWLREGEEHLVQRFDPAGAIDTIGFFIAKFRSALDTPR